MKVYVVWWGDRWETDSPSAVFSTEDKARKHCNKGSNSATDYAEFEVDSETLENVRERKRKENHV